ncbi:TPA: hypothetical protein N2Q63_001412, partial [Citrobacter freundii]|nr:hypothetical protein [Citrobacter freundii]HCL6759058.1 hypothetical protein [Citrobacter freundii]HED2422269.1 hypothetical protein [Citrobacter freundii]HED3096424.1 hypothetical protein [Citrobacter freundii]HED3126998.1 hypothetical protein [Citrobacter freundii]
NKEGYKRHASERYKENILNEYNNVNLKNLIPLQMTKIEIERSVALASKIKETLVEDDYYSWEVQMDAVPPAP